MVHGQEDLSDKDDTEAKMQVGGGGRERARLVFFLGAAASATQDFRNRSCPAQREVRVRAVDQRLGDLEGQSSNRTKGEAQSCKI